MIEKIKSKYFEIIVVIMLLVLGWLIFSNRPPKPDFSSIEKRIEQLETKNDQLLKQIELKEHKNEELIQKIDALNIELTSIDKKINKLHEKRQKDLDVVNAWDIDQLLEFFSVYQQQHIK
jgi:septal ring factor EnvC (AmiA/AmiB activator)